MCLVRFAKFSPCKVGYKVFRTNDHLSGTGYKFPLKGSNISLPISTWIHEKQYRSTDYGNRTTLPLEDLYSSQCYPLGFHIFHTIAAARKFALEFNFVDPYFYIIARVRVRKAHTTGFQLNGKVTVAEEIFITEKTYHPWRKVGKLEEDNELR